MSDEADLFNQPGDVLRVIESAGCYAVLVAAGPSRNRVVNLFGTDTIPLPYTQSAEPDEALTALDVLLQRPPRLVEQVDVPNLAALVHDADPADLRSPRCASATFSQDASLTRYPAQWPRANSAALLRPPSRSTRFLRT